MGLLHGDPGEQNDVGFAPVGEQVDQPHGARVQGDSGGERSNSNHDICHEHCLVHRVMRCALVKHVFFNDRKVGMIRVSQCHNMSQSLAHPDILHEPCKSHFLGSKAEVILNLQARWCRRAKVEKHLTSWNKALLILGYDFLQKNRVYIEVPTTRKSLEEKPKGQNSTVC